MSHPIKTEKPPHWDDMARRFDLKWENIAVTYGGVIYSPHPVEGEVLEHELVHVRQQKGWDAEEYMEKFLSDRNFRYRMELEAYRRQYRYFLNFEGHNRRHATSNQKLWELAGQLSGPMYGNLVSHRQALKDIDQA